MTAGQIELIEHAQRSWASRTFAGSRHSIVMAFDGAEAVERGEEMIAALPQHPFEIPGQLVVEAKVPEVDHRADPPRLVVTAEILLLENN